MQEHSQQRRERTQEISPADCRIDSDSLENGNIAILRFTRSRCNASKPNSICLTADPRPHISFKICERTCHILEAGRATEKVAEGI